MRHQTLTASGTAASATLPVQPVTLADSSDAARVGFRGRHAASYLTQRGYQLPSAPNQACRQQDGALVARLSMTEYLLLADGAATQQRIAGEEQAWQLSENACYLLPRQDTHAWLRLRGDAIDRMMAKLCAVDLSAAAFPCGAIAQTSVARATAIVINASQPHQPQEFWLLVDVSLAGWYSAVLADAAAEFRVGAPA